MNVQPTPTLLPSIHTNTSIHTKQDTQGLLSFLITVGKYIRIKYTAKSIHGGKKRFRQMLEAYARLPSLLLSLLSSPRTTGVLNTEMVYREASPWSKKRDLERYTSGTCAPAIRMVLFFSCVYSFVLESVSREFANVSGRRFLGLFL